MKNLSAALVVVSLVLFFSASTGFCLSAETDSFYCEGGEIIRVGDTKAQTITKDCKPLSKDIAAVDYTHTRYRDRDKTTETVLEDWTYKGRNGFLYNVRFAGSKIIKITNEGRP